MRMSSDEYAAFVDSLSPRSPIWGDLLRAGLVGGVICTLGQALTDLYTACGAAAETAAAWCSITLVFLGALLTGLGLYDRIARFAVKIFTIAGPVIVYGIGASVVYGLILAVCGIH